VQPIDSSSFICNRAGPKTGPSTSAIYAKDRIRKGDVGGAAEFPCRFRFGSSCNASVVCVFHHFLKPLKSEGEVEIK